MEHLVDYIRWRGGAAFGERPFCLTDGMVFCELSYLDLSGILAEGEELSFREVWKRFREQGCQIRSAFGGEAEMERLFEEAARSTRFGSLPVLDYIDRHDPEQALQFSVMTFPLTEELDYIAFRGTDDTIDGWKEDFMFSFTETEAQRMARDYLIRRARNGKRMIVGGHSKGANLAMYAAVRCPDGVWDMVEQVQALDGPGFCAEVVEEAAMERIAARTIRVVPAFCIVGRIMTSPRAETLIVRSSGRGLLQHDLCSWEVTPDGPGRSEDYDPLSTQLCEILEIWLRGEKPSSRRRFVDDLFDALTHEGNLTLLSDAVNAGADTLEQMLVKLINGSKETRRAGFRLGVRLLFEDELDGLHKKGPVGWFLSSRTMQYAALFVFGALLPFVHEGLYILLMIVIGGLTGTEIVLTVRRLRRNHWAFQQERARLLICEAMVIGLLVCLIKPGILFSLGTILFGAFIMVLALSLLSLGRVNRKRNRGMYAFDVILVFLLSLGGLLVIFMPQGGEAPYAAGIGILLALYALVHGSAALLIRSRDLLPVKSRDQLPGVSRFSKRLSFRTSSPTRER